MNPAAIGSQVKLVFFGRPGENSRPYASNPMQQARGTVVWKPRLQRATEPEGGSLVRSQFLNCGSFRTGAGSHGAE